MSSIFSFSLYYISFVPLWMSILFIDIKSCIERSNFLWTEKISILCILIFILICSIVLVTELCTNGTEGTVSEILIQAREEKTITAEYLLSYILPLFAFDFTVWNEVILFLIFFTTLGFLCIKHNYFSVNIVLELAGFCFYTCMLKNEDGIETEHTIISHRKLTGCIGDELYLKSLNNEYKLEVIE